MDLNVSFRKSKKLQWLPGSERHELSPKNARVSDED